MPEVDIIHIYEWSGPSYSAETPDGSVLHNQDEDFGVNDLAELGAHYGVTRWAERDDTLPDLDPSVVLVGWAEAPITRDDVEQHAEMWRDPHPAVNVKVYNCDLPKGDAFAEVVSEFDLDSRLAGLSLDELRSLIDTYIENNSDTLFNWACERGFEDAEEDAKYNVFPDYPVKVYSEGRSGGWLVVHGLPPIESWDVKLLTAWHQFETFCKDLVADIPRRMMWDVLANCQDDLAGRVVRVEVSMVLADADLEAGDPLGWDWRNMLDLSVDSTINVRNVN